MGSCWRRRAGGTRADGDPRPRAAPHAVSAKPRQLGRWPPGHARPAQAVRGRGAGGRAAPQRAATRAHPAGTARRGNWKSRQCSEAGPARPRSKGAARRAPGARQSAQTLTRTLAAALRAEAMAIRAQCHPGVTASTRRSSGSAGRHRLAEGAPLAPPGAQCDRGARAQRLKAAVAHVCGGKTPALGAVGGQPLEAQLELRETTEARRTGGLRGGEWVRATRGQRSGCSFAAGKLHRTQRTRQHAFRGARAPPRCKRGGASGRC